MLELSDVSELGLFIAVGTYTLRLSYLSCVNLAGLGIATAVFKAITNLLDRAFYLFADYITS